MQEISPKMLWISRVPERILEAKKLVMSQEKLEEIEPGYLGREVQSMYGGVEQRWLLVYSQQAYLREEKMVKKQVIKEFEKKKMELKKLCAQEFDCEKDAKKSLERWAKQLKYHHIAKVQIHSRHVKNGRGRPRLNETLTDRYSITAEIKENLDLITQALSTKGRFIVATNELDTQKLSSKEMLSNYKEQQTVERGFRFLKDPFFMTSSVFLRTRLHSLHKMW